MHEIETFAWPWLNVRYSVAAVAFYKSAFGATEVFLLEGDGGVVARLAIGRSEFWVSDESPQHENFSPETLNGSTSRMILTVPDPDAAFARACEVGARPVQEVTEEHGWRVGRVVDPFGITGRSAAPSPRITASSNVRVGLKDIQLHPR